MMSKIALVVGYIRVSTREQVIKGYSPAVQRQQIERYVESRLAEEPYDLVFYEDLGDKGGVGLRQHPDIFKRYRKGLSDALDLLVGEASSRETHFVVLDQSRLEREPLLWHILEKVYASDHDIHFHFVDEGGEMSLNPESTVNRGFKSLTNRSSRQQTARRVSQANEYRVKQGYHQGFPVYGWRKVANRDGLKWTDLEPDPELKQVVITIKDKTLAGWGSWRIARHLDAQGILSPSGKRKWYPETVRSVLRNPVHAGYVRWKDEIIQGRHFELRFWDMELTEELDRIITQRHRTRKRGVKLDQFLLAGMLTCGYCDRPLIVTYGQSTKQRYYRCNGRVIPTYDSHRGITKQAATMETAVTNAIEELLSDHFIQRLTTKRVEALAQDELAALRNEEQRLRHHRDEAARDLAETITQYRHSELSEEAYRATKHHIEGRIGDLEKRLDEAERRRCYLAGNAVRLQRAREAAHDFEALWEQLDTEERRGLLQAFIEEIIVTKEGRSVCLEIKYHFLPNSQLLLPPLKGAKGADGADSLSLRELAVLYLWDQGLRTPDIAAEFDVSTSAVSHYVYCIRRKLGTQDVDALVELVRERLELEGAYLPLSGRLHRKTPQNLSLSATQIMVLEAVAQGLSYKQMVARSDKSITTFYNAAAAVRRKLEAADNQEALAKAVKLDLLDLPDMDDGQSGAEGGGDAGSSASGQAEDKED